jgi:hypothetical protein
MSVVRWFARSSWKIALLFAAIYAAQEAGTWLTNRFVPHLTPSTEPAVHRLIMTAIVIYMLCMMLPFVPGMEIGLGLMLVFGPPIVPLVYGATVVALSLSFLVSRLIPEQRVISALRTGEFDHAADLLDELSSLDAGGRMQRLAEFMPAGVRNGVRTFHFLLIPLLLNLPGNAVIGGGGGIAMLAGFSRLFSFPVFVAMTAVAVSPVPLLIILSGTVPATLTE